ncbi:MAG: type IV secretion system protein VirB8 [Roseateles depolymerans]|uniref:Type IV secretion system protein VirB8 n=1 Tax=Roseateles depolymerans TaxID=76731 RepID=A0A2W5DI26_9BURK|nr:MAG: type IV secretion system protein VirB8 [Roseateles depolymerans]
MDAVFTTGRAAAWPAHATPSPADDAGTAHPSNSAWEIDRAVMLERSERRAWRVAIGGMTLAALGVGAVFVQGPLRSTVEIPIVVDKATGETTVQQRLSVDTIPTSEALDKHYVAVFLRAREGYNWSFLQRDFDQVSRMSVPAVFEAYNRQFEGPDALHKKLADSTDWHINVGNVRLDVARRTGNHGQATVTYEKVVHQAERNVPDVKTHHVASIVYEYQPKVLAKERDRLENPLGFVVTAYRSDPEINATSAGAKP